jgi:hypothetical protein
MGFIRIAVVAGCLLAFGCGKSTPHYPIPPRVAVYVTVDKSIRDNDGGLVAAVVDGLEAELRESGRLVDVIPAHPDERPPLPRIELRVLTADVGNVRARDTGHVVGGFTGLAIAAANASEVKLDCYWVPKAPGKRTKIGRWSGGSISDWQGAVEDGEDMGRSIGAKLLD